MARIAYVRVSSEGQHTDRQDVRFTDYDKVFTEKISGKTTDRPELKKLMEYVREGDSVTVESYSRFARNTRDLLNLIHDLDEKGVAFISLKEQVDTSTPQGRLMMHIFASLAEFELEQRAERQREGIKEAKEKDRKRKEQGLEPLTYRGRKRIEVDPEELKKEVALVREGKQTHEKAMQKLGLKPMTYFRRVKELQEKGPEPGKKLANYSRQSSNNQAASATTRGKEVNIRKAEPSVEYIQPIIRKAEPSVEEIQSIIIQKD